MSERDANALEAVERYSLYSAAAGLIPVPLVDMAAITGLQIKMLAEIAKAYDQSFSADRARPILASLIGGVASTGLGYGGGHLLKSLPLVGPVLGVLSMPTMAGTVTWAVGKVFMQHFASGGTLLDFDPEKMRSHFDSHVASRV
jgi:uncharacterized protein (DUF697 family)